MLRKTIYCRCGCFDRINPVFNTLFLSKLPENPVITPGTSVQVVRPSANNRFLQSVTVKAAPTTTGA